VRQLLSLPGETLFSSYSAQTEAALSEALLDAGQMDKLINLWEEANRIQTTNRQIVLSVDAVAFRPTMTFEEDG
jgi:hypothetical protein